MPPLPAADRAAGDAAHGERRELCVLLLRLLSRPSGQERQPRGARGRVAPGADRRRQLPLHEHHAVQPAAVHRRLRRCRRRGSAVDSSPALAPGHAGRGDPRRAVCARDLGPCQARASRRSRVDRARRRRRLRLFGLRHDRAQPAGLFRHRQHGADAVHRRLLSRRRRPRPGGARPAAAAGGGKRVGHRRRRRRRAPPAGA